MSRVLVALIAGALCALLAVPAALGKEGVRAWLETPVPLAAPPGKTITIAWTLSYTERGKRRPFGAGAVFVRLLSASGEKPTKAHGKGPTGRYVAKVTVPEGGIGGIEFGLEGTRYIGGPPGRGQAEAADMYFPLDNDPLAAHGDAARGSPTPARTADASWPVPIWLAALGVLGAFGVSLTARRALTLRRLRQGDAR
jgi:hypothetical protein